MYTFFNNDTILLVYHTKKKISPFYQGNFEKLYLEIIHTIFIDFLSMTCPQKITFQKALVGKIE